MIAVDLTDPEAPARGARGGRARARRAAPARQQRRRLVARALRRHRVGERRAPHEAQLRGAGAADRGAAAAAAGHRGVRAARRRGPSRGVSASSTSPARPAAWRGRAPAPTRRQVRARRVERRAPRSRSASTASTSASCSRASSRPRASRPPSCSHARPRAGWCPTPEAVAEAIVEAGPGGQRRALRAALLLDRRRAPDPGAAPGAPRHRRRRVHHHDRAQLRAHAPGGCGGVSKLKLQNRNLRVSYGGVTTRSRSSQR